MSDRATSFDRTAEEYERGRPGWPDAMLDLLPLSTEATVLDLGAGTGKLTRTLARRYRHVLAVEPLPGMRAILERELPEVEAHEGSAEAIPLADASVDAVFAGQAAHWFATREAIAEIARVLRPAGVLVAAWNQPDTERPSPLPHAYEERLARIRPSFDDDGRWARMVASGPFGPLQEASVRHDHTMDRDTVVRGAATMSWVQTHPERDEVLADLDRLLPPGDYTFPLLTWVTWAVRE